MKFLPLLFALFALFPLTTYAQATPVVHRSDYAACNGSGDDAPGIQYAINLALSQHGELDMGNGTCMIGSTVYVRDPSLANNAITLNVYGTGPGNLVLQAVQRGYPLMNIQNLQHSEFGKMKFSGGTGDDRSDQDTRNIGLVIGNGSPGLGSFGDRFYELQFEGFWSGMTVGDINTAGSAAEINFENLGADGNNIGILYASFNSLDVSFNQLNLGNNNIGFYSDSAYSAFFRNGAGANNGWTFMFNGACCQWIIEGWREEYGANTIGWIAYGSAAAQDQVVVIGSNTVDSLNPHRAFPVSIHALTSNAEVTVWDSMLNGAVEGKKVDLLQAHFTNGQAISGTPAELGISQSCLADINNGQCSFDIPDQGNGMYVSPLPHQGSIPATATPVPTNTPIPATATPVPPTATARPTNTPVVVPTSTNTPVVVPTSTPLPSLVRWDGHGTLSTTAPYQFAYLPLTVTNTGNTVWQASSVTVGYYWTDSAGNYISSDEGALTGDVQPGGQLSISIGVVTPAPGHDTLHVTMHRPGAAFGATLDLPVTIQ